MRGFLAFSIPRINALRGYLIQIQTSTHSPKLDGVDLHALSVVPDPRQHEPDHSRIEARVISETSETDTKRSRLVPRKLLGVHSDGSKR